jgi:hypothetical protein
LEPDEGIGVIPAGLDRMPAPERNELLSEQKKLFDPILKRQKTAEDQWLIDHDRTDVINTLAQYHQEMVRLLKQHTELQGSRVPDMIKRHATEREEWVTQTLTLAGIPLDDYDAIRAWRLPCRDADKSARISHINIHSRMFGTMEQ